MAALVWVCLLVTGRVSRPGVMDYTEAREQDWNMGSRDEAAGSQAVPVATEGREARHHFKMTDAVKIHFNCTPQQGRASDTKKQISSTQSRV